MSERICVGLVGCGNMGSALVSGVDAAGGRPAGFYDVDAERSAALAQKHGGRPFDSLDALLGEAGIDAVVVATLPNQHAQHVITAAQAGKHVFTEKPMALNVADCDRMIGAAADAGVTLMVGQVLRYIEPFQSIIRWSAEGRFGRPLHAFIQRVGTGPMFAAEGHWRHSLEKCGGFLFEVSVHELDFMRCLMGEPEEVYAVRQKGRPAPHEIEDIISVMVRFGSGSSGHYDGGTGWGSSAYRFNLCFERASLVSEKASDATRLKAFTPDPQPQEIPLDVFDEDVGVPRQMREWLDALRTGSPVPVPGEEGREAVRLAQCAYRSADTGRAVQPSSLDGC